MIRKVSTKKYWFLPGVILCSVLIVSGCREKNTSPVIARVGDAVLTVADLQASMLPEYNDQITREQNVNYVRQWIDMEILHQEALRRKIHKEKAIKERLKKMRKDLLTAEMISRGSSTANGVNSLPSDKDVSEYYKAHKQEFVREHDVVKYMEIVVDDPQVAQEIKKTITPENFLETALSHSKYPVNDQDNTPFIPNEEIPLPLKQAISSVQVPGITAPVQSNEGYHILLVLARYPKGELCTEEEVRDEILDRLSNYAQKKEAERMINEFRMKTKVEFNFELIPGPEKIDGPQAHLD